MLKIIAPKPEVFSLDEAGFYLLNLETGETRPVKELDAEAGLNRPKYAFLRAPGRHEARPIFYLKHNLSQDAPIRVFAASQHTQEGKLRSQADWEFKHPANPIVFERNQAGRIVFPGGVIIEIGWQKS
ncbi:MAG: hypothetical protein A3C85_00875 [Candidatus Doudnabacteria bacterium RIFCSPHIGHO2_02_FULL_48_21]|uniref:Uncharacterized protein n=1 Tax=Candidatus Doudnabacteria bacterium RIFCSPLOWO2_02_FULL_48_13 TaxID=1817845 RepID=A0A1F5QB83_9BACT|nr:MAG: hypothetical protein A3K05_01810 [Candidatus Doudnabacteria bacterium RIFCSPHIGHO2_01_48_18]OGE77316.1 MAG: hypothetical protein A2668_02720 [Candidatus Doudnabacteria bacterium RIFCSPHIGHO2_01_FULL_48_180]OGE91004.1 MAG: hypothetical protein A3F44_01615 [Candidatus Doudnabacteria bacterium RIFCSPHIGHO2_12_FULL_47_25]OGE92854.1 MAG: hypothetical protein A3C85_00875 [Candidatus Doudnabacteria bacterium RIFCSPHIGHO2_02_FULL_48_21]OGE96887.1 MAG: hypothetical protein A3A83_04115 [Candidatu